MFFMLTSILTFAIAQEGLDVGEAFTEAVKRGDVQAVETLLNQGVYVDTLDPSGQFTALMLAICENHINIVQILLNAGADVNFENEAGITPLMVASDNIVPGREVIVLELLKKGAHTMFGMPMGAQQLI